MFYDKFVIPSFRRCHFGIGKLAFETAASDEISDIIRNHAPQEKRDLSFRRRSTINRPITSSSESNSESLRRKKSSDVNFVTHPITSNSDTDTVDVSFDKDTKRSSDSVFVPVGKSNAKKLSTSLPDNSLYNISLPPNKVRSGSVPPEFVIVTKPILRERPSLVRQEETHVSIDELRSSEESDEGEGVLDYRYIEPNTDGVDVDRLSHLKGDSVDRESTGEDDSHSYIKIEESDSDEENGPDEIDSCLSDQHRLSVVSDEIPNARDNCTPIKDSHSPMDYSYALDNDGYLQAEELTKMYQGIVSELSDPVKSQAKKSAVPRSKGTTQISKVESIPKKKTLKRMPESIDLADVNKEALAARFKNYVDSPKMQSTPRTRSPFMVSQENFKLHSVTNRTTSKSFFSDDSPNNSPSVPRRRSDQFLEPSYTHSTELVRSPMDAKTKLVQRIHASIRRNKADSPVVPEPDRKTKPKGLLQKQKSDEKSGLKAKAKRSIESTRGPSFEDSETVHPPPRPPRISICENSPEKETPKLPPAPRRKKSSDKFSKVSDTTITNTQKNDNMLIRRKSSPTSTTTKRETRLSSGISPPPLPPKGKSMYEYKYISPSSHSIEDDVFSNTAQSISTDNISSHQELPAHNRLSSTLTSEDSSYGSCRDESLECDVDESLAPIRERSSDSLVCIFYRCIFYSMQLSSCLREG